MSVKTTIVPMLAVLVVVIGVPLLHCCSGPEVAAAEASLSSENRSERRACLEQDEISQFAEQLIEETGMSTSVLQKFRKGTVMQSDELEGTVKEVAPNQLKRISEIERDGIHKVWHIISGRYRFPKGERSVETYLVVRRDSTNLRRAGSCVLSHNYTWFCDTEEGSFGDAIIRKNGSVLHRIA